ncbi:MAG: AMP-binding protein, partial [Bacillota bacterium]
MEMVHVPNMTDYDQTYAEFKWEVPEYFNFARDVFDKWAQDPGKLAMWWIDDFGNERKITYAEFKKRSSQMANVLRANGVKKGDVVMLIMPRLVEWWETNLACIRAGAVVAPGTTMLTAKDIKYRLEMSEA